MSESSPYIHNIQNIVECIYYYVKNQCMSSKEKYNCL